MPRSCIPLILLLTAAISAWHSAALAVEPKRQDENVRQILQNQCLSCHSGDSPKGGFDLTSRESLLKGGDSGDVLDLEHLDKSRLLDVINHRTEPGMPFKRPKLSAAEIDSITRWVKDGAPYSAAMQAPKWWSLQALKKPEIPPVPAQLQSWPRNPVDHFVAAAWPARQLGPTPAADKRTLLRRVYFDLIGLPPTPADMEAYLADESPDAYERVVDRLLASPQYGERWARFWMDLAHYAETHGHDQDRPRPNAWPYRDYLIRAFNQDKPYARFVQEQIAGDALWPENPDALVAMGFLAAGPWDESSLRDIRDDTLDRQIARYLDRDDIVTTAMSTFVSTTVHCARCHDHKFDPVSQEDYYRVQAVFAGIDKGERAYEPDPAVAERRRNLQTQIAALPALQTKADPSLLTDTLQAEVAAWETQVKSTTTAWTVLNAETVKTEHGSTLTRQLDGSYLATGTRPEKEVAIFTATVDLQRVTGLRLEVLTDESLPLKGPGRQDNGNLHLNEITVTVAPKSDPTATKPVKLIRPRADFNQDGWSIDMAVDGNPDSAWGIHPQESKPHLAVFEFDEPVGQSGGCVLTIRLEQIHGREHLIGRARLSVTDQSGPFPLQAEALPTEISEALKTEPAARSALQQATLAAFVWKERLDQELAALPDVQYVYSASNVFKPDGSFVPAKTPRAIHVLKRGDIRNPGAEVTPGAMACIDDLPGDLAAAIADPSQEGQRRVAFARWLTNDNNILTWRSIVNRIWQRHFGRGIVDTPSDFGRMGATPTHPELLDWLAVTFREQGGSIKQLDRLLVTSATYRQSSTHRSDFAERDADARYLWKMPPTRLDAESVRDSVLQITGKLDPTMGGPSVKQFIQTPGIHVTPVVDYLSYDVDQPDNYRRSVYRFIFRTLPDPFMETLDCADSSQLTPVRNTSVTALQALATLNNRFMVRQSEHLAKKLETESPDLGTQIQHLYQLVLNRLPTPSELQSVSLYANQHGLANACRVLLNSNEFLFVN